MLCCPVHVSPLRPHHAPAFFCLAIANLSFAWALHRNDRFVFFSRLLADRHSPPDISIVLSPSPSPQHAAAYLSCAPPPRRACPSFTEPFRLFHRRSSASHPVSILCGDVARTHRQSPRNPTISQRPASEAENNGISARDSTQTSLRFIPEVDDAFHRQPRRHPFPTASRAAY